MHRDRIPGPDWRGFLVDPGGTFAGNHVKKFFDIFVLMSSQGATGRNHQLIHISPVRKENLGLENPAIQDAAFAPMHVIDRMQQCPIQTKMDEGRFGIESRTGPIVIQIEGVDIDGNRQVADKMLAELKYLSEHLPADRQTQAWYRYYKKEYDFEAD